MAEIVRRKSWGGVLPLGRHASISGSSFIQCASVSIALSSVQEGQTARHHKQFKLEQALSRNQAIELLLTARAMAKRVRPKRLGAVGLLNRVAAISRCGARNFSDRRA